MSEDILLNDYVEIKLHGDVIDEGHGHGECYKIRVNQKDYCSPREIWVDRDEIVNVFTARRDMTVFYQQIGKALEAGKGPSGIKWSRDKLNDFHDKMNSFRREYLTPEEVALKEDAQALMWDTAIYEPF